LQESKYEVIVIDNSSDGTARDTVAKFQHVARNLCYVHEAKLGLAAARNQGLRHARGELIAYIDDDAVADPEWLECAIKVCQAQAGTIGALAGRVRPIFETARPAWLTDDLLPFLSMTTLGDAPVELTGKSGLVGANMIFHTQALRGVGGFSADLGRKGERLISNEELHVQSLLEANGLRSIYHPGVAVSHHAPASRLTKQWFRRRLYWQGRSDAISCRQQKHAGAMERITEAKSTSLLIAKHLAHWLGLRNPERNDRSRFATECHLLSQVGYLVGLIR
jgi:GT2 family glycosyltransferase